MYPSKCVGTLNILKTQSSTDLLTSCLFDLFPWGVTTDTKPAVTSPWNVLLRGGMAP